MAQIEGTDADVEGGGGGGLRTPLHKIGIDGLEKVFRMKNIDYVTFVELKLIMLLEKRFSIKFLESLLLFGFNYERKTWDFFFSCSFFYKRCLIFVVQQTCINEFNRLRGI